jgi:hypothetical protein
MSTRLRHNSSHRNSKKSAAIMRVKYGPDWQPSDGDGDVDGDGGNGQLSGHVTGTELPDRSK